MKTFIIDGQEVTVSRNAFSDYKVRFKVEFDVRDQDWMDNMDIYSTTELKEIVEKVIEISKTDKVKSYKVIHAATKEQDEACARFIEETLKDI
jgi:hypothetical protein